MTGLSRPDLVPLAALLRALRLPGVRLEEPLRGDRALASLLVALGIRHLRVAGPPRRWSTWRGDCLHLGNGGPLEGDGPLDLPAGDFRHRRPGPPGPVLWNPQPWSRGPLVARVRGPAPGLRPPGGPPLPTQSLGREWLAVQVPRFPGAGWLTLEPSDAPGPPAREPVRADPGFLEAPAVRVDVLPEGTLTLVDRRRGLRWPMLHAFEVPGSRGWRPSGLRRPIVACPHPGPLVGTAEVRGTLGNGTRVCLRACLLAGSPVLRLETRADGPFRALFPVGREAPDLFVRTCAGLAVQPLRDGDIGPVGFLGAAGLAGGPRGLAVLGFQSRNLAVLDRRAGGRVLALESRSGRLALGLLPLQGGPAPARIEEALVPPLGLQAEGVEAMGALLEMDAPVRLWTHRGRLGVWNPGPEGAAGTDGEGRTLTVGPGEVRQVDLPVPRAFCRSWNRLG